MENKEIINLVNEAGTLKPDYLYITETQWKFLLRNAYRGLNILMTGPTGTGKTLSAQTVAKVLKRPFFYFNMGSTQDPRATLIGNTFFSKEEGTYFSQSEFIKAIQTPNAIILLDEVTRSHPEAVNILMTATDRNQRYIRLDESDGQSIINIANGVCFIGTANIGAEYTSTRTMDRAFQDRWNICEMRYLTKQEEFGILKHHFPNLEDSLINAVASIASETRELLLKGESKIQTAISSRATFEICEILMDGFVLEEAIEVRVYPLYSTDGGADSERNFIKQLVQKHIPLNPKQKKDLYDDQDSTKINTISPDNPFM